MSRNLLAIEFINVFIFDAAKITESSKIIVKKTRYEFDCALTAHESQLKNLTQTMSE